MSGCANGGFGGNGGFSLGEVIEDLEYIPSLELQRNDNTGTLVAPAVLEGASFVLPRRVRFNRLVFDVSAFAAAATGVILIYQEPRGRITSSLNLVATVPFTPSVAQFQVAPTEGTVILSSGFFYALWGQDTGAGSFTLRTYAINNMNLLTLNVPSGVHPLNATSAIDPATPPATLDPLIGGDLVEGGGGDVAPAIRFRNV